MITALDTHETVKSLTAAGFTDAQAEALTATVKQARGVGLSNTATKTEIAELRREIAGVELWLIRWLVGGGVTAILAVGEMIWTATQVPLRGLHA
jgi:hypothetical protein